VSPGPTPEKISVSAALRRASSTAWSARAGSARAAETAFRVWATGWSFATAAVAISATIATPVSATLMPVSFD
jgi:hypothetical protein